MYLVICSQDETGRVTGYRHEATVEAAEAAVARVAEEYPAAFYIEAPAADPATVVVDPITRAVAVSLVPPTSAQRQVRAREQIIRLEANQHRAVREAALGQAGAMERLQAIDDAIAVLRPLAS